MIEMLAWVAVGASLFFAAAVLVQIGIINRPPGRPLLVVAALAQLATVVLSVAAVIDLIGDHDGLTSVRIMTGLGYLVVALVAIPMGWLWATAENTRSSTAVMAIVGITQAFLVIRAMQELAW